MASTVKALFDPSIVKHAIVDAFRKLTPRRQVRNPVMFVVYVGSILTTLLWLQALIGKGEAPAWFIFWVSVWLWFTVVFANFAEAMAEGRGKAQAASLRKARRDLQAKRLPRPERGTKYELVPASSLRKGHVVLVEAGDFIPVDGTVIEGVASVNESAITGESAPVIRESGGDRSAVTGGTQVLSDWLVIEISANPGEAFLDRMISLVEGAKRQKTPNEIAPDILLAAMTIIFLLATATLLPYSVYSVAAVGQGTPVTVTVLVALLVCLIPTTIGALLSAIGIAGMDRMIQKNVIAMSGRAVEAAGDVDVLLLDKTGTITLGNRQATQFFPAPGVGDRDLADAAQLASLADETPEGRSIVVLAKERYGIRERDVAGLGATFVAFTAQTRMSGVNLNGRQIRKGAADAIEAHVKQLGGAVPPEVRLAVDTISKAGATPLVVADGARVLGAIQLKDIVKGGIRERFWELRRMGIKTVMITIVSLILLSVVTGLAYPAIVTGIAQVVFPHQANGSLIVKDGKPVGSTLIGQPFDDPKYFWGRPSATSPFPYNAAASSGSNLGPTNPALIKAVQERVDALRAADPGNTAPVPVDLVTASGSGLDPHISPAAAFYQIRRVARARGLSEEAVRGLVERHIEGRQLGFLGEPRVNVLALNHALDNR